MSWGLTNLTTLPLTSDPKSYIERRPSNAAGAALSTASSSSSLNDNNFLPDLWNRGQSMQNQDFFNTQQYQYQQQQFQQLQFQQQQQLQQQQLNNINSKFSNIWGSQETAVATAGLYSPPQVYQTTEQQRQPYLAPPQTHEPTNLLPNDLFVNDTLLTEENLSRLEITSIPSPISSTTSMSDIKHQQALTAPVAPQQPANPQLYKTELCQTFVKLGGVCPYGSKCQFAHGYEELKVVERSPKYRSKPCVNWVAKGTCRYGSRCCFKHGN